jgi:hypothetical protein
MKALSSETIARKKGSVNNPRGRLPCRDKHRNRIALPQLPDSENAETARRNSALTDQLAIVKRLSGMTAVMDVRVVQRDTT